MEKLLVLIMDSVDTVRNRRTMMTGSGMPVLKAADSGQEQGKPQEFPVSNTACQPARNGTVNHEADTIDAKDEAESLSRYAVDVLENKGRSGNIGKKGGKSKALHDTMTHEIRLTEQGRKTVQTGRHATGNASPLRQGFTHQTG